MIIVWHDLGYGVKRSREGHQITTSLPVPPASPRLQLTSSWPKPLYSQRTRMLHHNGATKHDWQVMKLHGSTHPTTRPIWIDQKVQNLYRLRMTEHITSLTANERCCTASRSKNLQVVRQIRDWKTKRDQHVMDPLRFVNRPTTTFSESWLSHRQVSKLIRFRRCLTSRLNCRVFLSDVAKLLTTSEMTWNYCEY